MINTYVQMFHPTKPVPCFSILLLCSHVLVVIKPLSLNVCQRKQRGILITIIAACQDVIS